MGAERFWGIKEAAVCRSGEAGGVGVRMFGRSTTIVTSDRAQPLCASDRGSNVVSVVFAIQESGPNAWTISVLEEEGDSALELPVGDVVIGVVGSVEFENLESIPRMLAPPEFNSNGSKLHKYLLGNELARSSAEATNAQGDGVHREARGSPATYHPTRPKKLS